MRSGGELSGAAGMGQEAARFLAVELVRNDKGGMGSILRTYERIIISMSRTVLISALMEMIRHDPQGNLSLRRGFLAQSLQESPISGTKRLRSTSGFDVWLVEAPDSRPGH